MGFYFGKKRPQDSRRGVRAPLGEGQVDLMFPLTRNSEKKQTKTPKTLTLAAKC